jgi:hypothetical protein
MERQLVELGLDPKQYLRRVRDAGKKAGYDPKGISLATDGVHKVEVEGMDARGIPLTRRIGAVGYGDFHVYSMLEKKGVVPRGTALRKQTAYLERATKIRGNWRKDKYSKNMLAVLLLW